MTDEYYLETPTPDYSDEEWAGLTDAEKRDAWIAYKKRERRAVDRDSDRTVDPSPLGWLLLALGVLALLAWSFLSDVLAWAAGVLP